MGRRHVATLMKRMGIEAIYRRPNTSKPAPGHKIYPYLLRKLKVERARPCLGDGHHLHSDVARLRLSGGGRRLGDPTGAFASRVDHDGGGVLRRGAEGGARQTRRAGNLQHGSGQPIHRQSTSPACCWMRRSPSAWTAKGSWRDNVFVERLWRSVKYEEVYLKAYDSVSEARASIGRYLAFYNERRPHSALDGRTPDEAYLQKQENGDGRMTVAVDFVAALVGLRPSRRRDKIETPREQQTPAEIHSKSAGTLSRQAGPAQSMETHSQYLLVEIV